MIKPHSDLTSLLAAAMRLVHRPGHAPSEIIRVGASRFRLITEYHENAGWLVVLVEAPNAGGVCDDVLKSYGLTAREMQVARLLLDRLSNREIAELLDVTVFTAGRHTERVLRKLGVASRRDVRSKLSEPRAVD
jgi:DNA-binding CsgD family transcriptional regulator